MIETKPRINRGNRGHGVARHLEEQPSESNVRQMHVAVTSDRPKSLPDPAQRHGVTTNNEQRTRKMSLSC